jgi:hypothetical protein
MRLYRFSGVLGGACNAQSDAFNPYQAVPDALPLQQAEPLIRSHYGRPVRPEKRFDRHIQRYTGVLS